MREHVPFFYPKEGRGQEIACVCANMIQLENRKNTTGNALEKENTYGTV